MSKNHDFLVIFGKNSAKNRKKSPFFHEKCIFFAFFCKKKHSGVRPLFLQNLSRPRATLPPRKTTFFRDQVLLRRLSRKTQKNKIKKKIFFYFFYLYENIFFLKKNIFIRKVSLRRVIQHS